jgi:hypothetical protein
MMFMLGGDPLAITKLGAAARIVRASNRGDFTLAEQAGLTGFTLTGLKEDPYEVGPHTTWNDRNIAPHYGWHFHTGAQLGQDFATHGIHEAMRAGKTAAEWIPNKFSQIETFTTNMYKVAAYLSGKGKGLDEKAALEQAHQLFVDFNGMSTMERTVMRNIFPFYAFTRHLFRYLGKYPADHPLRASIVTNFAEQEQNDWKSGLPRSYMNLFFLGHTDSKGNITAFDLKNVNPFRSFANDWSLAGFTSSLSPFISAPLAAMGIDTLSGTSQLYPGVTYNAQTGTLQATPSPGWEMAVAEAFVPQVGLLDHYFKLTKSTQLLAKYNPTSYRKQLYSMINTPFLPEVVNVPYEKEITEMRRFRAAQAAVALVRKSPSATNISKLLEWNAVPFDNTLISPAVLAKYYQEIQQLTPAGISPAAVVKKPPTRKAVLANY